MNGTYDVRIWALIRTKGARSTTYTVRWVVGGHRWQRTFSTAKLAEGFRTGLVVATREGVAFQTATGLPATSQPDAVPRSWLEHAMDYVCMKWPAASPRHRKGIAEALTDVTLAVVRREQGAPRPEELRHALYTWAFNRPAQKNPIPDEALLAFTWLERSSPTLIAFKDAALLRRVLERLALKQDGNPAAAATLARKRATFHSALEYAVELELFESNPLKRVSWKNTKPADIVDRRVVVNPRQARRLLEAVWENDPALTGFFACLYYAGLRPAEARGLRLEECTLPTEGWGKLLLTGSHQASGTAWTDSGTLDEERALKHRHRQDTRPVPAHPELVTVLRRHCEGFQLGVDGRLFVTRTARFGVPIAPPFANPVSMGTVYRAWHRARETALTERQTNTMLARRPYDLRHACLSTWLSAGVPPARVAEWAGHSVEVLLRVYAKCVEGDDEVALRRIENALRETE